jgi:hypothetical protein
MKKSKMPRWSIFVIVSFFFFTPAVGTWWFWQDMHKKIRADALPHAESIAETVMTSWDEEELRTLSSGPFHKNFDFSKLAAWSDELGELKSLGTLEPHESGRMTRNDQALQYTVLSGTPEFENGKAKLHLKIARLYLIEDWKVEELNVEPVQSGE